jgi:hypothetical protein
MTTSPLTIAFHLPQFHPIPENDTWWGPGFTEWTNVAAARPLFPGHEQPDLPGELGFYDLRLRETRLRQLDLAKGHGVGAFCYYHYWFSGHRLLGRPIDDLLADLDLDQPFALCWANESWTRRWDGKDHKVLMEQRYDDDDFRQHGRWLASVFSDMRYLRFNRRPVFLVYRALRFPDPKRSTDILRDEVTRQGIPEPYLVRVESHPDEVGDPAEVGFDAAVAFQPSWRLISARAREHRRTLWQRPLDAYCLVRHRANIWLYDELYEAVKAEPPAAYLRFPTVTTGWDNTPRRKKGAFLLRHSTPERYETWLRHAIAAAPEIDGRRVVFVNAWNEWAEGCHLEPSRRWGRAYLEAHRRAVSDPPPPQDAGRGGERRRATSVPPRSSSGSSSDPNSSA